MLSGVRKGRVEVGGNVEVFRGQHHKRVRQDGNEVLCAEKATIST